MDYNKLIEAMIAIEIGKIVLIEIANNCAECDNIDDAGCIIEQIYAINKGWSD